MDGWIDDWAPAQGPGPGPKGPRRGARGPMTGPGPRGPGPHTGPWAPRLGPLGPGPGPWAGAQSSIHPSIHLFLYVSMVNTVYTVYMVYMVYMASMVYTALFCKPHPGAVLGEDLVQKQNRHDHIYILFRWLLKPIPTPLISTIHPIQRVVDFNGLWVVDFNGLG